MSFGHRLRSFTIGIDPTSLETSQSGLMQKQAIDETGVCRPKKSGTEDFGIVQPQMRATVPGIQVIEHEKRCAIVNHVDRIIQGVDRVARQSQSHISKRTATVSYIKLLKLIMKISDCYNRFACTLTSSHYHHHGSYWWSWSPSRWRQPKSPWCELCKFHTVFETQLILGQH